MGKKELYTQDHTYNRIDWATTVPLPQSTPAPQKPLGRNELYTQDYTYNIKSDHHSSTVRTTFRETLGRNELYTQDHTQTPSTGLRHPSFGGRCRKAMLGVWATPTTSDRATTVPQSVPFSEEPVGIRNELYTQDHTYNTRPDHHSTTISTIFRETPR